MPVADPRQRGKIFVLDGDEPRPKADRVKRALGVKRAFIDATGQIPILRLTRQRHSDANAPPSLVPFSAEPPIEGRALCVVDCLLNLVCVKNFGPEARW